MVCVIFIVYCFKFNVRIVPFTSGHISPTSSGFPHYSQQMLFTLSLEILWLYEQIHLLLPTFCTIASILDTTGVHLICPKELQNFKFIPHQYSRKSFHYLWLLSILLLYIQFLLIPVLFPISCYYKQCFSTDQQTLLALDT